MSFCAQDLSVLAYANGFTHWHYRTQDSLALLTDDRTYFAATGEMLRPGDQITVNLLGPQRTHLATLVVLAIATPLTPELGLVAASLAAAPPAALAA